MFQPQLNVLAVPHCILNAVDMVEFQILGIPFQFHSRFSRISFFNTRPFFMMIFDIQTGYVLTKYILFAEEASGLKKTV